MILVDTSVWIDHLRKGDIGLRKLLEKGQVLSHPFVIGELAMGNLKQREVILSALQDLPEATVAHEDEVLQSISNRALFGLGIGYIDAHLLAAVQMTPKALLWTRDKRLFEVATKLSLAFDPHIKSMAANRRVAHSSLRLEWGHSANYVLEQTLRELSESTTDPFPSA